MCQDQCDFTYGDLNPKFLYSCIRNRTEDEENYHAHDFIEIVVVMKGKGRFCIDDQEYDIEEGNLILLNPGMHHRSLVRQETGTGAVECYLSFTGVEFKNCRSGYMPLFQEEQFLIKMPDAMKQDIFMLCNAIDKEAGSFYLGRYFMLKAYLIQILCLIARAQQTEKKYRESEGYIFKSAGKKYVVQQIMKYMEEHYQEKISLDQIAENMYLSSFYISKIFKSETGDTPINYLISLRMERAKDILDNNPEESVQKVAAAVGYEDAYHFSKLFKKYYGLSPLYYKGRARI